MVSKTPEMTDTIQKVDPMIIKVLSKRRSKSWGQVSLTQAFEIPSALQGAVACIRLYQGSFNRKEIRIEASYSVDPSGSVVKGNHGLAPIRTEYSSESSFSKREESELSAIMSEVFDVIR